MVSLAPTSGLAIGSLTTSYAAWEFAKVSSFYFVSSLCHMAGRCQAQMNEEGADVGQAAIT
jgi:hypothetical protein